MKKRNIIIASFVILLIIIFSGGTFAYLSWQSASEDDIIIDGALNENFSCSADGGEDITSDEIIVAPATCDDSEYAIMREINVKTSIISGNPIINMQLYIDVNLLGSGLSDSQNFNYVLSNSNTSCTDGVVASGNFNGKKEGSKIKILDEDAILPTRGSEKAAGWDLYANISAPVVIAPGRSAKISSGIAIELPEGTFGGIFARSGLSTKKGLRPANCVGVIDEDYRGPVIVPLYNDSKTPMTISPDERIAQLIIIPYMNCQIAEVSELSDTERAENGFGSTGTN
jgi:dUTP pyrophosphatase